MANNSKPSCKVYRHVKLCLALLCLPKITPGRCKRILTVLLTLFFFKAGIPHNFDVIV